MGSMAKASWWHGNRGMNPDGAPKSSTTSNSGQFTGSPYQNPQMSQASRTGGANMNQPSGVSDYAWWMSQNQGQTPQVPQGWGNTGSAMYEWQSGFKPDELAWHGGPAPGHIGQTPVWNPMTGQYDYVNTAGGSGVLTGGKTPYGPNAISYVDPTTGLQMTNLGALDNVMGALGRLANTFGGQQNAGGFDPTMYELTDYSGQQITAPGGYTPFDHSTIGSGIDPSAVIDAQEYKLQEAMEGDMARAGGRLGQSGFAMSTPYANELGDAARKAAQDRNALTLQYQYDAAQAQAARDLQQQMQAAQHHFDSWLHGGNWGMQAQLANQAQALQQWLLENQMGMQNVNLQNQYGYQNYQDQQNNDNMQQQLMMSILGGLF